MGTGRLLGGGESARNDVIVHVGNGVKRMAGRKELFARLLGVYLNRVADFTRYVGLAPGAGLVKGQVKGNEAKNLWMRRGRSSRSRRSRTTSFGLLHRAQQEYDAIPEIELCT